MKTILVTGSEGLIGTTLTAALQRQGRRTAGMDCAALDPAVLGDIRNPADLAARLADCAGIVHLAAISRVSWGERDPELCWQTNVAATETLMAAAAAAAQRPWVLLASSREVYGEPKQLPIGEDAPHQPVNVYGRSKAAAEQVVERWRAQGHPAGILRFANVYGSTADHPDRVAPAFARAAAEGAVLRVHGRGNIFDFTHVDDVADGILAMAAALDAGERLPPIHLATGRGINLGELAQLASAAGDGRSTVIETPAHAYNVSRFVGDPRRARELLGWQAAIGIEDGLRRLVRDFAALAPQAGAAMARRDAADPGPGSGIDGGSGPGVGRGDARGLARPAAIER